MDGRENVIWICNEICLMSTLNTHILHLFRVRRTNDYMLRVYLAKVMSELSGDRADSNLDAAPGTQRYLCTSP